MPTYVYKCKDCAKTLEAFHKMSDPPKTLCPFCLRNTLERVIVCENGFILQGSGWPGRDLKGAK